MDLADDLGLGLEDNAEGVGPALLVAVAVHEAAADCSAGRPAREGVGRLLRDRLAVLLRELRL
jgi:hypothetical protein